MDEHLLVHVINLVCLCRFLARLCHCTVDDTSEESGGDAVKDNFPTVSCGLYISQSVIRFALCNSTTVLMAQYILEYLPTESCQCRVPRVAKSVDLRVPVDIYMELFSSICMLSFMPCNIYLPCDDLGAILRAVLVDH